MDLIVEMVGKAVGFHSHKDVTFLVEFGDRDCWRMVGMVNLYLAGTRVIISWLTAQTALHTIVPIAQSSLHRIQFLCLPFIYWFLFLGVICTGQ